MILDTAHLAHSLTAIGSYLNMEPKMMLKRAITIALAAAGLSGCATQVPESITTQPASTERPLEMSEFDFDRERTLLIISEAFGEERGDVSSTAEGIVHFFPLAGVRGAVSAEMLDEPGGVHFRIKSEDGRYYLINFGGGDLLIEDQETGELLLMHDSQGGLIHP